MPDEVHNASLLNQYLELLSPSERENVFCMKGDKLQKRALLARVLVRTTLARCTVDTLLSILLLDFTSQGSCNACDFTQNKWIFVISHYLKRNNTFLNQQMYTVYFSFEFICHMVQ